jgi:hypothetical protein
MMESLMARITIAEVSPELIKDEVSRYWIAFAERSSERLKDFYGAGAMIFSTSSAKQESAQLTVARRTREYLQEHTTLRHELGPIEVVVLPGGAAVASYTFRFSARNVSGPLDTNKRVEAITQGRATQVFLLSTEGDLQIVHEHFSEPVKTNSK